MRTALTKPRFWIKWRSSALKSLPATTSKSASARIERLDQFSGKLHVVLSIAPIGACPGVLLGSIGAAKERGNSRQSRIVRHRRDKLAEAIRL